MSVQAELLTAKPPKLPPPTEAEVLDLLRARHMKPGNGGSGEYAFLTHVRDGAAFDARRTFDALTVSLWPSRGLTIDIFEVKVSRADWQRELADPQKAEDACRLADRFWIACPAGTVRDGELPPTWGLMEVTGGKLTDGVVTGRKLRTAVAAPLLHGTKTAARPVSRGFLVGLLRSAPGAVPKPRENADPAEVRAAYDRGRAETAALWQSERDRLQERLNTVQKRLGGFERATGIRIDDERIGEIATAVRAALDGERLAEQHLKSIAAHLRRQADVIEQARKW